ncbi:hypothetical protein LCGC14_2217560, partial [marine sediment metagenome]
MCDQLDEAPKPEAPDWLFNNIAEASKNARSIYLLYLGFVSYCLLTAFGTTDRQIFLNEQVSLPIIKVDVSLYGFFIVAPIIAIFIFLYLQLYLGRLKGLLSDLRENYAPLEKRRLYPWMLNIADDPEPGFMGWLQRSIVILSLWWSLPLTLAVFAISIIRKHDEWLSYGLSALPLFATVFIIYFWLHHERDSDKEFGGRLRRISLFARKHPAKTLLSVLILLFTLLMLFIPYAHRGEFILFNLDLRQEKLITEPDVDYKGLYWADLKLARLEGANLYNVV